MFDCDTPRKRLYASIKDQNDGLDVGAVAQIFNQLLLPEPRAYEYRSTSDWGFLVFLNDQACTLRITSNLRCPPLEHHRILKPLLRIDLGQHRLDINPGIKLGNSILSVMRMSSILLNDNIHFWDNEPRNCGSIPGECTDSFFDYTVICDEGACESTAQHPYGLDKLINNLVIANDNDPTLQDRAYGDLRHAFREAIEARSDSQMRKAWQLCSEKKDRGHLRADWTNPPKGHPEEIQKLAKNYSDRLTHLKA